MVSTGDCALPLIQPTHAPHEPSKSCTSLAASTLGQSANDSRTRFSRKFASISATKPLPRSWPALPCGTVSGFARSCGLLASLVALLVARSGTPDEVGRRYQKTTDESVRKAEAPSRLLHANGPLTFHLKSGNEVVGGRVNAWAYIPSRFDAHAPLHVIVLFHGFRNCIASYVSRGGEVCQPGSTSRTGYDLANQMERAESGAILVVPEIAFDVVSSDPGKLGEPGALHAFMTELLDQELVPYIGEHRSQDIERFSLMASSGGYQALVPALNAGGEHITDLVLLDACYVYKNSAVGRFLFTNPDDFDPAKNKVPKRFGLIYSHGAGAFEQSEIMRDGAEEWLANAHREDLGSFFGKFERPRDEEPVMDDFRPPIFGIFSHRWHDVIVERYFWQIVRASGI
jgi:hypothetical protein